MPRLLRYETTWTDPDNVTRTVVYYRARTPEDVAVVDKKNEEYADDIALYSAKCELGDAFGVETKMEIENYFPPLSTETQPRGKKGEVA